MKFLTLLLLLPILVLGACKTIEPAKSEGQSFIAPEARDFQKLTPGFFELRYTIDKRFYTGEMLTNQFHQEVFLGAIALRFRDHSNLYYRVFINNQLFKDWQAIAPTRSNEIITVNRMAKAVRIDFGLNVNGTIQPISKQDADQLYTQMEKGMKFDQDLMVQSAKNVQSQIQSATAQYQIAGQLQQAMGNQTQASPEQFSHDVYQMIDPYLNQYTDLLKQDHPDQEQLSSKAEEISSFVLGYTLSQNIPVNSASQFAENIGQYIQGDYTKQYSTKYHAAKNLNPDKAPIVKWVSYQVKIPSILEYRPIILHDDRPVLATEKIYKAAVRVFLLLEEDRLKQTFLPFLTAARQAYISNKVYGPGYSTSKSLIQKMASFVPYLGRYRNRATKPIIAQIQFLMSPEMR